MCFNFFSEFIFFILQTNIIMEKSDSLEFFCDQMLHRYYDLLIDHQSVGQSTMPMTYIHFKDELIWLEILRNLEIRQALTSMFRKDEESFDNIKGPKNLDDRVGKLLVGAISCLQLYVIDNFLFHIDRSQKKSYDDCLEFVKDFFTLDDENCDIHCIEYSLDIDGETISPSARNIELLKLSRLVFEFLNQKFNTFFQNRPDEQFYFILWSMRSAIIHQSSLSSSTGTLYDEILDYTKRLESILASNDKISNSFKMNLFTEIVNIFTIFGDQENSKKYMTLAKNHSDVLFDLIGRLGLRTQFQTKPVSQLMVNLKRLSEEPDEKIKNNEVKITITMPFNEPSEDNTLFQEVKFIDEEKSDSNQIVKLKPIEQSLMVTWIKFQQRFGSATDELLREELLTYIYFLLQHCDHWILQFILLEMRSLQERLIRRRVERSLKQFQTLFETIRYSNKKFFAEQAFQRIRYFYSVLSNPFWKIEKQYADLLFVLGVYKSALDVYLRLQQWREIIECYRRIGLLHKAEEIIREKLTENDNQPDMHCLLGEITGDLDCFHYSWKISNHQYARAPKMLGLHYFDVKDYEHALEYFRKSIDVNSMQVDVWYRMGYIGLIQEDWNLSVMAYRKVLQFDTDSFEAWNNLSKAYIKLGDKERAMKTLQEALKCDFEQWKIWENYIAVCADLGEVWEIIQSWHRLIDIKKTYLDDQVADILVKCLQEHSDDQRLISKSIELFGRITSTSPGTAKTWNLYARLLIMANRDRDDVAKIEQCLQKSQRQILMDGWEKNVYKMIEVLNHFEDLAVDIFEFIKKHPQTLPTTLGSFRLSLNSILGQVNKTKSNLAITEPAILEKLNAKIDVISQIQNQVIDILKK
ncbi:tetratricopeptide repeat protein 27 [Dermatophagoides pteronyssinus]|uniref:Tetratricopeptide repeat protein 27-like n=2 Tax=Dermatophagoides pteronyssinus TaxID=6956 RepID=A0A6P6Y0T6_DERPT|nr:tetratricopeptide repeat protein 27-like [Dermatophagoides pteronyssinus]